MSIPGAPNPADGLKEVAKELKDKFEEAGMGAVDTFVDTLEDLKENAAKAPEQIMDAVKGAFGALKDEFEKVMENPASLVPGNMACVASFVGKMVVSKLQALLKLVTDQIENLTKLATSIVGPMKNLGKVLGDAMAALESSLKQLSKLPKQVGDMASTIDSPDDIAKIDVSPMKKSLDVKGIGSPLDNINGLKDGISSVAELATSEIGKLVEFVEDLPNLIRHAFDIGCCCNAADGIQPLADLLGVVDKVKAVPTQDLLGLMGKTKDAICNMDVNAIKTPVETFAKSAGGPIDKLEKTVQGAKLASNPTGAVGGMFK